MILLMLACLFALPVHLNSRWQDKVRVIEDDKQLDAIGYNNCDMTSNGELFVIQTVMPSNGIIFDVGANIGEWSSSVLKYNPEVKLFIFEPIPDLYKKLCNMFRKRRVSVFDYAISDSKEEKSFEFYPECSAVSGLYHRPALAHMQGQQLVVNTTTLDLFCKNNCISDISFLKIDTEGNEWKVLTGATELLSSQSIKMIQFEYGGTYPDAHITLKQVYEFLRSMGYEIFRIAPNYLIHISQWRNELENSQYSNYLAVK